MTKLPSTKPSAKFTKKSTQSPSEKTQKTPSKRKTVSEEVPKQVPEELEIEEPKKKNPKKAMTPDAKYTHFLQRSVVRGKVVKMDYLRNRVWGCFYRS